MKRKLAKETSKEMLKLGAAETINSGNWGDGDAIRRLRFPICWRTWDSIMIESKMTEKKSFPIKKEILDKIAKEANIQHALAVLYTGLINEDKYVRGFVTLRSEDFKSILEYIEYLQQEVEDLCLKLENVEKFINE